MSRLTLSEANDKLRDELQLLIDDLPAWPESARAQARRFVKQEQKIAELRRRLQVADALERKSNPLQETSKYPLDGDRPNYDV